MYFDMRADALYRTIPTLIARCLPRLDPSASFDREKKHQHETRSEMEILIVEDDAARTEFFREGLAGHYLHIERTEGRNLVAGGMLASGASGKLSRGSIGAAFIS
jgi:hypothetical protein